MMLSGESFKCNNVELACLENLKRVEMGGKGKTGHINEVKPWITDVRKERDWFLLLFFPLSFTVTFLKNTYILASPCTILHLNLSALLLSLPLATKWSLSRRLPITSSW